VESEIVAFLDELQREGRAHDVREPEHAHRMLNLEPETAQLVTILVQSGHRKQILEIGTSNGYSTIWLAWAARAGGRVTSLDRDPDKHALADANLRRVGLRDVVDLICGDATETIRALPGPFDCVFFDADRRSAPAQLDLLLPRLAPDVLILADNARSHPDEIAAYLAAVARLPGFAHLVVPIGKGLSVAYRGTPPALGANADAAG